MKRKKKPEFMGHMGRRLWALADVPRIVEHPSVTVSEHAQLPATADSAIAHGISCTLYSKRAPAEVAQNVPTRLSLASNT